MIEPGGPAMYELRGRRLLPFLLCGFDYFPGWLGLLFLLVVGGWVAVACGCALAFLHLSSLVLSVRVDSTGIEIRNRFFFRRRVPWSRVGAVTVGERGMYTAFPLVRVLLFSGHRFAPGGYTWFGMPIAETLGMDRSSRLRIAESIAAVGRTYGYEIPHGSSEDIRKQRSQSPREDRPRGSPAW